MEYEEILQNVIKKSEEDLREIIEAVKNNTIEVNDAITQIQILISLDFK